MLVAIVIAAEFAQNCQNLPKDNWLEELWMPPRIQILVFLKNTNFYV
jgi:hypothetical protein